MTYTKDQLARVIVYLADKVEADIAEDVADCIDWAREQHGTVLLRKLQAPQRKRDLL